MKIYNNKSYVDITNVDSKEISYVLGFLWADGYFNTKRNTISTSINTKDSEDINKIFGVVGNWNSYSYKSKCE